jgi:hypothetical protein
LNRPDIGFVEQARHWFSGHVVSIDLNVSDVDELQQLLQSKYALQFAVIYDVERLEKGGEVQVADSILRFTISRARKLQVTSAGLAN